MRNLTGATPLLPAALLTAGLMAAGCAPGAEVEPTAAAAGTALARARSATEELGGRLKAELGVQLASGTPAIAIDVCSQIAPAATRELSHDGLEIRRTSLRHRNPGNAPDPWERAALERYAEIVAGGGQPGELHEVDAAGGELRYLRPIMVGGSCLLCHGAEEQLDPQVRQRLAERYPEDRATGFAAGDLRGAFSVRVRLDRG